MGFEKIKDRIALIKWIERRFHIKKADGLGLPPKKYCWDSDSGQEVNFAILRHRSCKMCYIDYDPLEEDSIALGASIYYCSDFCRNQAIAISNSLSYDDPIVREKRRAASKLWRSQHRKKKKQGR